MVILTIMAASGQKRYRVIICQKDVAQNLPSAIAELQRRVIKAEATIEQKEGENAELREQLKQFERRWIEYETKMKSMEEMWQKQMLSLQMSLAAARKSLSSDNGTSHPIRQDASDNGTSHPIRHDAESPSWYDSEDNTSFGSRTPGLSTPMKYTSSPSVGAWRQQANASLSSSLSTLMKEFEYRRHTFDIDARSLVDVRPAQSGRTNPIEEYRKLKHRFEVWKKEFKVRLRMAKATLNKIGNSEVEKSRRTWWEKLSSRALQQQKSTS